MKHTIAALATAIALSVSTYVSAADINPEEDRRSNSASVVSSLLDASAFGRLDLSTLQFSKDFEYHNTASGIKAGRKAYSDFLKSGSGYATDSKSSFLILDETARTCIAKIDMVFENFTRVDYVRMTKMNGEWEISKVVTSYL